MHRINMRRGLAVVAIIATSGLMAACVPSGGTGAPKKTFTFTANSVTVNDSQDETCFIFCVGANDEPYVINIGFSVDVGKSNSATTNVVVGDNQWSGAFDQGPGEGESDTFEPGQQAAVTFADVPLLQFSDIVANAVLPSNQQSHLRVVGVWTWAMEADLLGVSALANDTATILGNLLNTYVASSGGGATSASQLINMILDAIFDNILGNLGALVGGIVPFVGDDYMGSRMYIGLGVRGDLKSALSSALSSVSFPSLDLPVIPDLLGGQVVALGSTAFNGQVFNQPQNGGDKGAHTYNLSFTQS